MICIVCLDLLRDTTECLVYGEILFAQTEPDLLLLDTLPEHGNLAGDDFPTLVLCNGAHLRPNVRVVAHFQQITLLFLIEESFQGCTCCLFFGSCRWKAGDSRYTMILSSASGVTNE